MPWYSNCKYQDINLVQRLTFKQHIHTTCNKFRVTKNKLYPHLGWNCDLSIKNKLLLYNSYLRPIYVWLQNWVVCCQESYQTYHSSPKCNYSTNLWCALLFLFIYTNYLYKAILPFRTVKYELPSISLWQSQKTVLSLLYRHTTFWTAIIGNNGYYLINSTLIYSFFNYLISHFLLFFCQFLVCIYCTLSPVSLWLQWRFALSSALTTSLFLYVPYLRRLPMKYRYYWNM